MRDYNNETIKRVNFIKDAMQKASATSLVFGNSGGKDSALVGILAKMACENTVGVIMPCKSTQNYNADKTDGLAVADKFNIETITVDLSIAKDEIIDAVSETTNVSSVASTNINPRLRMTTLYAIAQTKNALVLGTGNKCEIYMGYFTKYGDGGCDLNPISDLLVSEVYEFLEYLEAPLNIITKAPSAGLYEGQTDELEMGVSYKEIEDYINGKEISVLSKTKIQNAHNRTTHKRALPLFFPD
ncbi:MAG: NAD(+) synthase [Clostridia bacterium]